MSTKNRWIIFCLFTISNLAVVLHTTVFGDETPPNILFVISDDWGVHAGAYGTPWIKTPAFDRVAKEGLLFQNAFTPTAKCAPSRACILTGRKPWQLEEAGNHMAYFPSKFKSWPEVFVERGWHMGITGKGWGPGIAKNAQGKTREITGVAFNKKNTSPPAKGISNNNYAENFVDFLDAAPAGKPWCFWCGFQEPHRAYEYQSGVAKGGKQLSDIDRVPKYWPDNSTVRNDMLDYAYEVEYVDSHLSKMLAELERRMLDKNTLVVVTSDHGMPFPRGKGYAYRDSNHVPLAIRYPEGIRNPGGKIADFVDFSDIAATFLDYAHIPWNETSMQEISGKSWRPVLESPTDGRVIAERDHALLGKERTDVGRPNDWGYPIRGLVNSNFLYLKNYEPTRWPAGNPETGYLDTDASPTKTIILEMGRSNRQDPFWKLCFGIRPNEELYDLSIDPDCVINLAGESKHAERMQQMKELMESELKVHGDPRMFGNGKIFDEYPPTNGKGFYDAWKRGEKVNAGWVSPTDFEKEPIPVFSK